MTRGDSVNHKDKMETVDDFVRRVNPYEEQPKLNFDLRGYSKYIEEHNIPGDDVPEEVIAMFQKKPKDTKTKDPK